MSAPRLVAITGADGTGKSTLCRALADALGEQAEVAQSWDALDGLLSQEKAQVYLAGVGHRSRALLLLHAVSRALDLAAQREVPVLLLDGYWYKYAVSELERGAPPALFDACELAFPRPEVTFVLDLPLDRVLARKASISAYERGDAGSADPGAAFVAFQQRLGARWRALEDRVGPWVHLSAEEPLPTLVDRVTGALAAPVGAP